MKLGDGRKSMGKAFRTQIQQRLHEHVNLQRVERGLSHIRLGTFSRIW